MWQFCFNWYLYSYWLFESCSCERRSRVQTVHHSYIPTTVTTTVSTSRWSWAELQPASHSIPIRPGLISISVVTAARALAGWLCPHSPSLRAHSLIFLPAQPGPGPSFSLISVVILCCTAGLAVHTTVHTSCTLHHYTPITLPILTTWPLISSNNTLFSPLSFFFPLKHHTFLSVSLFI